MISKIKSFLFENRSTRQTITKNFFWLTASQLGSRLIRAIVIIYAARILGASEYGIFSYALGLAGFFTVFSDVGVGQVLTREAAKDATKRSYYFATAFWIKVALLLFVALIIIFVTPYLSRVEGIRQLLPIIAFLVVFDGLSGLASSFFRAMEKMEWDAITTILTNTLITASGFIVLYFYATTKVFTVAYALSVAFGTVISLFIIREEVYKVTTHGRRDYVKPILKSALPIAFVSILGQFMLNTDLVMLGWWQTPAAIGYYSAGQRIVQILFTLPSILAISIFPTLSRLIGNGESDKIKSLMEKSLTFAFLLSLPIVVGGVVMAKPIINLVYGAEYLPAVGAFQALLVTILILFPGTLINDAAIAFDKQGQITKYLFAAAVTNAVFDAIFIPIFGIIGSAIATIIAITLNTSLSWRLLKRTTAFYILPNLKKIIISSIIMGLFSLLMNRFGLNVIINIGLSSLIYLGLLLLLKEKILEEFRFMTRAITG